MSEAEYQHTANRLRRLLDQKRWQEGEQLPSHPELARELRTSNATMQKAVQVLVREGRLETAAYRGTRVAERWVLDHFATRSLRPDRPTIANIDAFAEIVHASGREPGKRFRTWVEFAEPQVQAWLGLGSDARVVVREVTELIDDRPWGIEKTFYPLDLAEELGLDSRDDIPEGTTRRMAARGKPETAWVDLISARPATQEDAEQLGISIGMFVEENVRIGSTDERLTRATVLLRTAHRNRNVYELGSDAGQALIREALTASGVLGQRRGPSEQAALEHAEGTRTVDEVRAETGLGDDAGEK